MIITSTTATDIARSVDYSGNGMGSGIARAVREYIKGFEGQLDVDQIADDVAHAAMTFFGDLDLTTYTIEGGQE